MRGFKNKYMSAEEIKIFVEVKTHAGAGELKIVMETWIGQGGLIKLLATLTSYLDLSLRFPYDE